MRSSFIGFVHIIFIARQSKGDCSLYNRLVVVIGQFELYIHSLIITYSLNSIITNDLFLSKGIMNMEL